MRFENVVYASIFGAYNLKLSEFQQIIDEIFNCAIEFKHTLMIIAANWSDFY